MHYLSNKFSKISKHWGFSASSASNFRLGQIVFFQTDYDKNPTLKISYDGISVASSQLRHRNNVIIFYLFWAPPSQKFWLRQWVLYDDNRQPPAIKMLISISANTKNAFWLFNVVVCLNCDAKSLNIFDIFMVSSMRVEFSWCFFRRVVTRILTNRVMLPKLVVCWFSSTTFEPFEFILLWVFCPIYLSCPPRCRFTK